MAAVAVTDVLTSAPPWLWSLLGVGLLAVGALWWWAL
jgi:hypothetical protein